MLTVLERTSPVSQENINTLQKKLNFNDIHSSFCIKQVENISFQDITPEKFGAKVIFIILLMIQILAMLLIFLLNGAAIGEPGQEFEVTTSAGIL